MTLPSFKYHPDPVATGSVVPSDNECRCCHGKRGFIYAGPVFSIDELADSICPWCIADGSAHKRFNAAFSDSGGVNSYGSTDPVPQEVIEEVAFRTPGFLGWQQEHWVSCCGDAAAFLGLAGSKELEGDWKAAQPAIKKEAGLPEEDWPGYLASLDKDGSPTAYVFQCLHCRKLLGYSDMD